MLVHYIFQAAHEMEQLLKSISRINVAKQESGRHFQSHIFFDNGVRDSRLTEFALQLVSIVKKTLGKLYMCPKKLNRRVYSSTITHRTFLLLVSKPEYICILKYQNKSKILRGITG